jgi:hypothetical protein
MATEFSAPAPNVNGGSMDELEGLSIQKSATAMKKEPGLSLKGAANSVKGMMSRYVCV